MRAHEVDAALRDPSILTASSTARHQAEDYSSKRTETHAAVTVTVLIIVGSHGGQL